MPTYSYRCTECGTAFDIQQAFTDDTLTVCPNCGGKLRKLFTTVGVTFNGSGFYRTDSRAKTAESGASASPPAATTTTSDSSSSSTPKPTPAPAATGGSSASSSKE